MVEKCCNRCNGLGICPAHTPFEQGMLQERDRIVKWLRELDSTTAFDTDEVADAIENGEHLE